MAELNRPPEHTFPPHERLSQPERTRDLKLRGEYGITLAEYDQMFEKQQGVCAICHCVETASDGYKGTKRLAVDHDHKTDQVRGLLCQACNHVLGFAKDNSATLIEAARYLDETQHPL